MTGSTPDALAPFHKIYARRDLAAREWKAAAGRVMAYVDDGVPDELIAAAGFLPYRLSGDPGRDRTNLNRYFYPVTSKALQERHLFLRHIEAIVEALLGGAYDFVDYLVIPYTRKEVSLLYGQLQALAAHFPELVLPPVILLDRAMTSSYAASHFNRASIERFLTTLEELAGKPVSVEALTAEIAAGNEGRALLAEVASLRASDRPLLSGTDALAILGSSRMMPREEHNRLLQRLLAGVGALQPHEGARLFVAGSPLDHAGLYETVEACGAVVVGENHNWGRRIAELPIDASLPPIAAVAERFHKHSPGYLYPLARSVEACVSRAKACGAEAALFHILDNDTMQMFETPDERQALEEAGLATMVLQDQSYAPDAGERGLIGQAVRDFMVEIKARKS